MIYKNAQENVSGSIDCLILLAGEWVPNTQDPALEYELSEELGSDDWADIKPCPQAEKDVDEAEQAINQAIAAVQGMLDSTAQSKGYDNINSAIGYAEEPSVEKFQLEGRAFRQWRSLCWAKCYELQAGGVMPDDLLSEMPRLEL